MSTTPELQEMRLNALYQDKHVQIQKNKINRFYKPSGKKYLIIELRFPRAE